MRGRLTLLGVLLVVLVLVIQENRRPQVPRLATTSDGRVEMCLPCHGDERLDPAHAPQVVGCSPCHLGDPLAVDKTAAHAGMVKNPGDLRLVERTCGVEGCHSPDVHRVKNTLMATNRGILATLLYYWGEADNQNGDFSVEELIESGETSLARDYYRKLCATCHLWKQKGDLPGVFGEKGGGCTACHAVADPKAEPRPDGRKPHPLISRKVPSTNCIRCHNRSGRIGLSYTGRFESEGYGTPFEAGQPSAKRMSDRRFAVDLPADVHYAKGMACIDCHTRDEIMGDGTRYAHYEEQLEIQCATCHTPGTPGRTRKGKALNNLRPGTDGTMELLGKIDGRPHPLAPPKPGVCDWPLHKRLSCEACHSAWVPQCYGCHVRRDNADTDLDKLSLTQTQGWWSEGRSFIRYERPALAVWGDEVVVVTPGCQDLVTLLDANGEPERQFNRLTMAAINPHTTAKQGRACGECHTDPKTLGLGAGTLWREGGEWRFTPLHQGEATPIGTTPPLDALVTMDGTPLQHTSRPDLRPFNGEELVRILRVGRCIACHDPGYHAADRYFKEYRPESTCADEAGQAAMADEQPRNPAAIREKPVPGPEGNGILSGYGPRADETTTNHPKNAQHVPTAHSPGE